MFFDDKPAIQPGTWARGEHTGLDALFSTAADSMERTDSQNARWRMLNEELDARNKLIFEATGVKKENPLYGITTPEDRAEMMRDVEERAKAAGVWGQFDPAKSSQQFAWAYRLKRYERELAELVEKYPHAAQIIGADVPPSMMVAERAQQAEAAAGDARERRGMKEGLINIPRNMWNDPLGMAAMLAGGIWGQRYSPADVLVMLGSGFAGSVRKSLLHNAALNAVANAGGQALLEPGVQGNRAAMGLDYGIAQSAENVASAALMGGALDFVVRGGVRGVRAAGGAQDLGGVFRDAPAPQAPPRPAGEQPAPVPPPSPELIEGIRNNDPAAIREAVKTYGLDADPTVRGALHSDEADAITQHHLDEVYGAGAVDMGSEVLPVLRRMAAAMEDPDAPPQVRAIEAIPEARSVLDDPNPREIGSNQHGDKFSVDGKEVVRREVDLKTLPLEREIAALKAEAPLSRDMLGRVMLYERLDGSIAVLDGNKRVGLAQASPETDVKVPAIVLKESAGWTEGEARAMAARENIKLGDRRDPIDIARQIRETPGLIDRSVEITAPVAIARALAKLSDDAFEMVRRGDASPMNGVAVADHVADPGQHAAMLRQLQALGPEDVASARAGLAALLPPDDMAVNDALMGVRRTDADREKPLDGGSKIDDPMGAEAKKQTQILEQSLSREIADAKARPERIAKAIDKTTTAIEKLAKAVREAEDPAKVDKAQAELRDKMQEKAALEADSSRRLAKEAERASKVEQAIERLAGIVPEGVAVKTFTRVADLPAGVAEAVIAENQKAMAEAVVGIARARTQQEQAMWRARFDQAQREQIVEGMSLADTIWIATYAAEPEARIAHEVVHALKNKNLLQTDEVGLLATRARELGVWRDEAATDYLALFNDRAARSGLDGPARVEYMRQMMDEEAAAHLIDAHMRGMDVSEPAARTLLERIAEALRRLREFFRAQNLRTADDVIEAILSGQAAKRELVRRAEVPMEAVDGPHRYQTESEIKYAIGREPGFTDRVRSLFDMITGYSQKSDPALIRDIKADAKVDADLNDLLARMKALKLWFGKITQDDARLYETKIADLSRQIKSIPGSDKPFTLKYQDPGNFEKLKKLDTDLRALEADLKRRAIVNDLDALTPYERAVLNQALERQRRGDGDLMFAISDVERRARLDDLAQGKPARVQAWHGGEWSPSDAPRITNAERNNGKGAIWFSPDRGEAASYAKTASAGNIIEAELDIAKPFVWDLTDVEGTKRKAGEIDPATGQSRIDSWHDTSDSFMAGLKANGYDALVQLNTKGEVAEIAVLDAAKIRPLSPSEMDLPPSYLSRPHLMSAISDASTGRDMRRALDSLGFYSKALEAAKSLKQAKGTPEQMLAQLKSAGVKDAEIEATNLKTFLEGKKSVTRDEIVSHLEGNRVGLREVKHGEPDSDWLNNYARNAGYDSAETAAQVLGKTVEQFREDAIAMFGSPLTDAKWQNYSLDPSNPTYRETVLHLPEGVVGFQPVGAHFPEPNIVGHMMTSMVKHEGKPVYLIDQIQSDWGQKIESDTRNALAKRLFGKRFKDLSPDERKQVSAAKQEGDKPAGVRDEAKIAELEKRIRDVGVDDEVMPYFNGNRNMDSVRHHMQRALEYYATHPNEPVPQEFKRALDVASRAPDDVLMWIVELSVAKTATPGNPLVNTTDQWVNTTLRRAIRIAAEADANSIAIPSGDTVLSYNPGDTEGMRGFYDGIVPKNLRNLLSKLDKETPAPQKVDKLQTPSKGPAGSGFTVFPLTDKVKQAVLTEGQPMFAFAGPRDDPVHLQRAKALGFDTSKVWYHGTSRDDFEAFKGKPFHRSTTPVTWFSPDPDQPNAMLSHGTFAFDRLTSQGARIIPVYVRPGKQLVVDAKGEGPFSLGAAHFADERAKNYASVLADAKRDAGRGWSRLFNAIDTIEKYKDVRRAAEYYGPEPTHIDEDHQHLKQSFRLYHLLSEKKPGLMKQLFEAAENYKASTGTLIDEAAAQGYTSILFKGMRDNAGWQDQLVMLHPKDIRSINAEFSPWGASSDNLMFAFAGERARTADLDALAQAKQMMEDGKSREDIWTETGWFRGKDGKWRWEIDDSGARLTPDAAAVFSNGGKLPGLSIADDVLPHDNLYRAYPSMAEGPANIYRGDNRGQFSNTGVITVSARGPTEGRGTMLHELQHGVQAEEGTAGGGSPSNFSKDEISAERQRLMSISNDDGWTTAGNFAGDAPDKQIAFRMYERLAGEVEARAVQKRMNLTPEERRARPPWLDYDVPEDQQIVRFADGSGADVKAGMTGGSDPMFAISDRPVTPGLDMSPEARKQRAEAMGFDTERVYYHSTRARKEFDAFQIGRQTRNSSLGMPVNTRRYAVFVTPDKAFASEFADDGSGSSQMAVMPLFVRMRKTLDATSDQIDKVLGPEFFRRNGLDPSNYALSPMDAWQAFDDAEGQMLRAALVREGYDSVSMIEPASTQISERHFDNAIADLYLERHKRQGGDAQSAIAEARRDIEADPRTASALQRVIAMLERGERAPGPPMAKTIAILDPRNIRSINAAFDPANADSPNLMFAINDRPRQEAPDYTPLARRIVQAAQPLLDRQFNAGPLAFNLAQSADGSIQGKIDAPQAGLTISRDADGLVASVEYQGQTYRIDRDNMGAIIGLTSGREIEIGDAITTMIAQAAEQNGISLEADAIRPIVAQTFEAIRAAQDPEAATLMVREALQTAVRQLTPEPETIKAANDNFDVETPLVRDLQEVQFYEELAMLIGACKA